MELGRIRSIDGLNVVRHRARDALTLFGRVFTPSVPRYRARCWRSTAQTTARLGCNVIAHTANQSPNSLRRFDGAMARPGFEGWHGTPREFPAKTRDKKIKILCQ
jgi:hypothetical protein